MDALRAGSWKFATRLAVGLFIVAVTLLARMVAAQTGIVVVATPPPQYTFGEALAFQITAQSAATIDSATFFYRTADSDRTLRSDALLAPAPLVTATYSIDLTGQPLTPFTTVEYWWEIHDTAGGQLTTEPQTFYYEDNRFGWQTLTQSALTVHWYRGDAEFGQTALDIAGNALEKIGAELQTGQPADINIYIYSDADDIRAALNVGGKTWVSGHADPALGVVMVPVPPGQEAGIDLEREIPHELTHLLVYKAVGNAEAYARVPTWLNEGLAVLQQGQPNPDYPALIANASKAGQLLSLQSLCGPFPAEALQAELAYAESEAVVRFIREQFGSKSFATLLAAYADGASCASGVERGLGVSLAQLENQWLTQAVQVNPGALKAQSLRPWVIPIILILLAPFIFFGLTARNQTPRAATVKPKP